MIIRPFEWTEEDYEAMVFVDNAVFKSYELGIEEWRHQDESRDPDRYFQRDMIESEGGIIAYGQFEQQSD